MWKVNGDEFYKIIVNDVDKTVIDGISIMRSMLVAVVDTHWPLCKRYQDSLLQT